MFSIISGEKRSPQMLFLLNSYWLNTSIKLLKKLAFHLQLEAACHSENCDNEEETEHIYFVGLKWGTDNNHEEIPPLNQLYRVSGYPVGPYIIG